MEKIHTRLYHVFQILDQVTGYPLQSVEHPVSVRLFDGTTAIEKQDGYFIFIQSIPPGSVLTVQAYGFQKQELQLSQDMLAQTPCQVYMKPDGRYRLTKHLYGVVGRAIPDQWLYVVRGMSWKALRLQKDYTAGDQEIFLMGRPQYRNDEQDYQIRQGKQMDCLRIVNGTQEKNGFLLAEPLSAAYQREAASIYPVTWIRTDHDGHFCGCWKRKPYEQDIESCEIVMEGQHWVQSVDVQAGKWTVVKADGIRESI